jgi:WD40 repeat protein
MRRFVVLLLLLGAMGVVAHAQETPVTSLNTQYATVYALAYNADGTRLATLSLDRNALGFRTSLQIWDADSLALLGTLQNEALQIYQFAFDPLQALMITTSNDGQVSQWNLMDFQLVNSVKGHESPAEVVFSPDGQTFVTSDWSGVVIWSASTFEPLHVLASRNVPQSVFPSVAISPDSQFVAWVALPSSIVVYNIVSGTEAIVLTTGYEVEPYRVLFTPKGLLALAYGTLEIWDIGRQQRVSWYSTSEAVKKASYSADATLIAILEVDGGVSLWDVATQTRTRLLRDDQTLVWDMAFRADGKTLAIALDDGRVEFYAV